MLQYGYHYGLVNSPLLSDHSPFLWRERLRSTLSSLQVYDTVLLTLFIRFRLAFFLNKLSKYLPFKSFFYNFLYKIEIIIPLKSNRTLL